MPADLRKEQTASCKRPPYRYSLAAKVFFRSMDLFTGNKTTLPKVKLIEILASIPYRSWETRQYTRMTQHYRDRTLVQESSEIMMWAREAQDTEYWHLLVVNEKMKADGIKDPWYLVPPVPLLMVGFYAAIMHVMAIISIRRAFLFNAEFEDHAEHVPFGPGFQVPFAARVRTEAGIASGAVGFITEPAQAEQIVATGQADVVFLGRQMLRDPYWPLHAAKILNVNAPWPNQYLRAK